ncbi:MAG: alpha/beta hydrolase [Thaumarchaeota archaeon]|nr:alpha/beta hydrolase [Nitrososphaerota archaeon]
MTLAPDVEEYLRSVRSAPSQHMAELGVAAARKMVKEFEVQYAWDPGVGTTTREATVPVKGASIPVRVYAPPSASDGPLLPVLVWIHGGGWVLGNVDSLDTDAMCRYLSAEAGCLVVSVGYRLSPESKFPVPAEDSYAALKWAVANVEALHADGRRVAVAGDSAGGNLAVAVCLVARDRGGPHIRFQAPIYPVIDPNTSTQSYRLYGRGYGLDTEDMVWFWKQYLRTEEDAADPYACPLRAKDLAGLPPALVMTAGLDPLRDEGEAYGKRLGAAGVPTSVRRVEDMPHGFITMPFGGAERKELATALRGAFD